jgi:hypothetical protein
MRAGTTGGLDVVAEALGVVEGEADVEVDGEGESLGLVESPGLAVVDAAGVGLPDTGLSCGPQPTRAAAASAAATIAIEVLFVPKTVTLCPPESAVTRLDTHPARAVARIRGKTVP